MHACLLSVGKELALLLATFGAEPAQSFQVIEQTYRFGEHVVTVTPRSIQPVVAPAAVESSRADLQVTPAIYSQTAAPPLPEEADSVPMPPPPAEVSPEPSAAAPCPQPLDMTPERGRAYREVYDAIPFSRAEYDANPSYRHEAAMELLFGQLRPTVVHRQQTRIQVDLPAVTPAPWAYNPYGMNALYYPFYQSGVRVYRGR